MIMKYLDNMYKPGLNSAGFLLTDCSVTCVSTSASSDASKKRYINNITFLNML